MFMYRKRCLTVALVCSLIICFIYQSHFRIKAKSVHKYILYWLPIWDEVSPLENDGSTLFEDCDVRNCFATYDKTLVPIENFAAIVFHSTHYSIAKYSKPWARASHQRYIFANTGPPYSRLPEDVEGNGSFYNWTLTYRWDSDIVISYRNIIENSTNFGMPTLEVVSNKTGLIAGMAGPCNSSSRKVGLVHNLQKFVIVHMYGACGNQDCPKDGDCFELIARKYKFYLDFENTYSNETMRGLLGRDIVPVVGGVDDEQLPRNSVIVAKNSSSVPELAYFLMFLDAHSQEYLKYFKWKEYYYIDAYKNNAMCKLCKKLNNPSESRKIYQNIVSWWTNPIVRMLK